MSKYEIVVEIRHKIPAEGGRFDRGFKYQNKHADGYERISLSELYDTQETASRAYGFWHSLLSVPQASVMRVELKEHSAERTQQVHSKEMQVTEGVASQSRVANL
jgi:hypothetical protein